MRFIPALDAMTAYQPGRPIDDVKREFGLTDVVKLASNEWPEPPFPEVQRAIAAATAELNRYPEGPCTDLREALAAHYGRPAQQICVGAGSQELLMLLGQALLRARRRSRLRGAVVRRATKTSACCTRWRARPCRCWTGATTWRPWPRRSRRAPAWSSSATPTTPPAPTCRWPTSPGWWRRCRKTSWWSSTRPTTSSSPSRTARTPCCCRPRTPTSRCSAPSPRSTG